MVCFVLRKDKEVINKGENVRQVAEDIVDVSLQGLGGVTQSEWHEQEFEKTKGCNNGCFFNVFLMNWYLMECLDKVNFGEHFAPEKTT